MIEEGVLITRTWMPFSACTYPELDVGTVGRYGSANACSDDVIEILGNLAHGAKPDEGIDAIVVSAQVVNDSADCQRWRPRGAGGLTIGTIAGGSQANIIADSVKMTGTLRTLDSGIRERVKKDIENITANVCSAMGARHRVTFEPGYPLLVNDETMTNLLKKAASKIVGDKVVEIQKPRLGVEDFAYYLEKVPGAFWRLGTANRKGIRCIAHSPYFDIDEDALCIVPPFTCKRCWNTCSEREKGIWA